MRRQRVLLLALCAMLWALPPRAPAASAPTIASLPDWSGVWEPTNGFLYAPPGQKPNVPSLTPEYAAKYKLSTDAAAAGRPINDPTANCIWPGMPRVIGVPYPSEYIFQEGRVTILNEYMSQVRRIWTDGRGHPKDLEPSFNGHSIGRWEGATLVVDTVGLRADTLFDQSGLPHSGELTVRERIRLVGPDTLENEVTMTDPLAFTRPWVATLRFQRHRDWQILEYVCAENNRNPVSASGTTLTLDANGKPLEKTP